MSDFALLLDIQYKGPSNLARSVFYNNTGKTGPSYLVVGNWAPWGLRKGSLGVSAGAPWGLHGGSPGAPRGLRGGSAGTYRGHRGSPGAPCGFRGGQVTWPVLSIAFVKKLSEVQK